MQITMLYSKIHRATVTDAKLNYIGSITVDIALLEESGIKTGQRVDIVNVNNGERFSTYVIPGKRGEGEICLNGAAARKVHVGDKIIIIAYALMTEEEAEAFEPRVVIVDDENRVAQSFTGLK